MQESICSITSLNSKPNTFDEKSTGLPELAHKGFKSTNSSPKHLKPPPNTNNLEQHPTDPSNSQPKAKRQRLKLDCSNQSQELLTFINQSPLSSEQKYQTKQLNEDQIKDILGFHKQIEEEFKAALKTDPALKSLSHTFFELSATDYNEQKTNFIQGIHERWQKLYKTSTLKERVLQENAELYAWSEENIKACLSQTEKPSKHEQASHDATFTHIIKTFFQKNRLMKLHKVLWHNECRKLFNHPYLKIWGFQNASHLIRLLLDLELIIEAGQRDLDKIVFNLKLHEGKPIITIFDKKHNEEMVEESSASSEYKTSMEAVSDQNQSLTKLIKRYHWLYECTTMSQKEFEIHEDHLGLSVITKTAQQLQERLTGKLVTLPAQTLSRIVKHHKAFRRELEDHFFQNPPENVLELVSLIPIYRRSLKIKKAEEFIDKLSSLIQEDLKELATKSTKDTDFTINYILKDVMLKNWFALFKGNSKGIQIHPFLLPLIEANNHSETMLRWIQLENRLTSLRTPP